MGGEYIGFSIPLTERDEKELIRVSLSFEDSAAGWDIRFVELQKKLDMDKLDLT
jgi:hypothetical protein